MSNGRAKRGGEVGVNGEYYAGGTFLPATELPKGTPKARKPSAGPRRQQVARYEWADTPAPGQRSIYAAIVGTLASERDGVMQRHEGGIAYYGAELHGWHVDELIAAWNRGERWYEARS